MEKMEIWMCNVDVGHGIASVSQYGTFTYYPIKGDSPVKTHKSIDVKKLAEWLFKNGYDDDKNVHRSIMDQKAKVSMKDADGNTIILTFNDELVMVTIRPEGEWPKRASAPWSKVLRAYSLKAYA